MCFLKLHLKCNCGPDFGPSEQGNFCFGDVLFQLNLLVFRRWTSVFIVLIGFVFGSKEGQCQLIDVSDNINLETNHTGGNLGTGVSFVDFTGDYIDDLTFGSHEGELLFFEGTGSGFIPINLGLPDYGHEAKMVLWGDIDNDGDRDLFVSFRLAPNRLYVNNGDLTFTDVSSFSGLNQNNQKSFGASFGDYNKDGFLDLHVCNYTTSIDAAPFNELYRNLGNESSQVGVFSEESMMLGMEEFGFQSFQSVWVDFNEDDLLDLHVIRDRNIYANYFYEQQQNIFHENASDFGLDIMINSMSNSLADFDHNGFQDLYLTGLASDGNLLLGNNGGSFATDNTDSGGSIPNDDVQVNDLCWAANWLDVDNNGFEDLHVATGFSEYTDYPAIMESQTNHPDWLFYNDGGNFTNGFLDTTNVLSFATAVGDFNLDGFPDLVSHRVGEHAQVLRSTPNGNHWVKITTEGVVSNFDGIGAKIQVFAGGERQYHVRFAGESYLGQNSAWEHFGLGSTTAIDSVMISWPSGIFDILYDLPIDNHVVVIEGGEVFLPFGSAEDCVADCSGCTYAEACNYNPDATEDDGSCDFNCWVTSALCAPGTVWDDVLALCVAEEGGACATDIDGDGEISIMDLLILLAQFNLNCP